MMGALFRFIIYTIIAISCIEIIGLLTIYYKTNTWVYAEPKNPNNELFRPHPYLVGVPKKNISIKNNASLYTHNQQGFRGNDFINKSTKTRVVAIGGSTTYGVSVNDHQTWPYYLDSLLGNNYEVLNLGIPGHTTSEHIILSALHLSEYAPDVILFNVGLNDIRNQGIKNLSSDYSDFHAPTLFGSMGFCYQNDLPKYASLKILILALQKLNLYPVCSYHSMKTPTKLPDTTPDKALHLFKRNLNTLIEICKELDNPRIIFIPQVLDFESIQKDKLKWWIPFLSDNELMNWLKTYNKSLADIAHEKNTEFVQLHTQREFSANDFADPCHMNSIGNLKLAKIVAQSINKTDLKR